MSSLQKTNQELIEYLDHMSAQLNTDYAHVCNVTEQVLNHPKADDHIKAEMAWALSQLTRDSINMHQTIKKHQQVLRDAETQSHNSVR